jgi:hypothetical protein
MTQNKHLIIFSELEKFALYALPDFDNDQRRKYFNFLKTEKQIIFSSSNIHINIFCALQLAYFKAKKIFYKVSWDMIPRVELDFIINAYFPDFSVQNIILNPVSKYHCYKQQKLIIELFDYKAWTEEYVAILIKQSRQIIKRDTSTNFIAHELLNFLHNKKIVRPGYSTLQNIVSKTLVDERTRVCKVINDELNEENKLKIDILLLKEDSFSKLASLKQDAKNFRFKMMLEERTKHGILEDLYPISQTIISKAQLSKHNINYYTNLASHYTVYSLRNLKFNQNYLYILCYVYTRYKQLTDNLVEAFNYNLNKSAKNIREEVKANFINEATEDQQKIGELMLLFVDESYTDDSLFTAVRKRAFSIMPKDSIHSVGQLLVDKPRLKREFKWLQVDKNQHKHKKNLRPLFMKLKFTSESENNLVIKSAVWLQNIFAQDERLSKLTIDNCPKDTVPKYLQKYLSDANGQLIANRYEYWLYSKLNGQITNNQINVDNSNLYGSFNKELVSIEQKKHILKTLDIPWFTLPLSNRIETLKKELNALWTLFGQGLMNGKFKHLEYNKKTQKLSHLKPPPDNNKKLQKKFFKQIPFCEIDDVLKIVDDDCQFLSAFPLLQPRYSKTTTFDKNKLIAAILAQAFNFGNYKMSQISDISYQELETAYQQRLRLETLKQANDILSNRISKLTIFPSYSLDFDLLYGSVDGQKFELNSPNIKARYSRKYLREGQGVSAYTLLANHLPLQCKIIGTHEHESYFLFDVWQSNNSTIIPDVITGDMHIINKANFAIMNWFGPAINPRFKDFNKQLKHLYCTRDIKNYKNFLIKPVAQIDLKIITEQKNNIDQLVATLALKELNQANLIKKLCHLPISNKLRKAVFEYDKLIRSIYTLKYMMDTKLQKTVDKSQNRIESYHQLRAAISKVGGKKQLYGKTDIDVEISNQCNRLVSHAIIYYNSIILSKLVDKYEDHKDKDKLLLNIKKISPVAWHYHIHFLGQYTFQKKNNHIDIQEFLKTFEFTL